MTKRQYEKITVPLRKHPHSIQVVKTLNKAATILVYFAYPVLLLALALHHDVRLWKVLLTPAISFILVSIFRNSFNAPRPYEVLNIVPIIHKDTKGKSFPSRHVFSIFVIAMTFYYISMPMGICLMILGIMLALVRVIGGVHFPKDVIAGAIIGILSGVIGLYL